MIFDAHTHVGDFGPMFNVSLDRDGLAALIEEHLGERLHDAQGTFQIVTDRRQKLRL